jgi:flotillin
MFDFVGTGPLLVVVSVVILALLASFVASRYKVAGANEALIVAGSRGAKVRTESGEQASAPGADRGIRVVVGGGTFVMPLIHKSGKLKLVARQIPVSLPDAVTSQGLKVKVEGVATFKIGRDVESIRLAAERFLDASDEQIDSIVRNILEGSLRAIVGTLTIEDLISDRQKLLAQVQEAAAGDLTTSGLVLDSFTIQSINDVVTQGQVSYIEQLGAQKLAIVVRDAAIAKARAEQESAVAEAEAKKIEIGAQRDQALVQAEADIQTATAHARAEQAEPLSRAQAAQEVTRKESELAQLQADLREKELLASVIKPAEAESLAAATRAEGEKNAAIQVAQAGAEQIRLEGTAQADIIRARGEAEANALELRAEAFRHFNEAAVIQTVLAELPKIVAAAAEPMRGIDNLTVLSADGATDVVRTGTRAVLEASTAVKGLTGIDLPSLLGSAFDRYGPNGDGDGAGEAPASARPVGRGRASGATSDSERSPSPAPVPAPAPAATQPDGSPTSTGAAGQGAATGATAAEVPEDLDAALDRVTQALRQVPGIERYRDTTLAALAARAPARMRPAVQWAREQLPPAAGEVTIGDLLDRPA